MFNPVVLMKCRRYLWCFRDVVLGIMMLLEICSVDGMIPFKNQAISHKYVSSPQAERHFGQAIFSNSPASAENRPP